MDETYVKIMEAQIKAERAWQELVNQKRTSALHVQVGGEHYKKFKIQPVEYITANKIPFCEGCAIKYISRWRDKGGIADLEKAKHFIDLIIELEKNADNPRS